MTNVVDGIGGQLLGAGRQRCVRDVEPRVDVKRLVVAGGVLDEINGPVDNVRRRVG